jgi:hypothetical protein
MIKFPVLKIYFIYYHPVWKCIQYFTKTKRRQHFYIVFPSLTKSSNTGSAKWSPSRHETKTVDGRTAEHGRRYFELSKSQSKLNWIHKLILKVNRFMQFLMKTKKLIRIIKVCHACEQLKLCKVAFKPLNIHINNIGQNIPKRSYAAS